MPLSSRKRTSTSYDSDNGFVASDNSDRKPTKKAKTSKADSKTKKPPSNKSVQTNDAVAGGGARDQNGDEFWELTTNRRVVVSKYGGKLMVNVREYYEKDGQSLPGKKGISMPVAQFGALVALLPHIESVLKSKGEVLPRPEYDKVDTGDGGGEGEDEEEEEAAEEDGVEGKKNFEATSEEEE